MGRRSFIGGIISGAEPSVNGAGASGMWTLQTAAQKKTANTWPIRGVNAIISNTAPIIGNVAVTDSGYNVINDTPYLSTTGGYIRITGANFASGAVVYVGGSAAVTTSFISSTELRAQIGAGSSNTVPVYVVNSDNGTGIKLAAVTYSGTPNWVTSATLTTQSTDIAFSVNLSATSDSAIVYTLDTGSSLPPGTSLFSNGVFAGTVANTSITVDTAYSFLVVANDAENQDSSRTFTVTVALGDPFFYLTPLLLKGDTGNNWITDASTNKFSITVSGDTRPAAFSPYVATYWSGYFDGTGDFLTIGNNSLYAFGTSAYTIEFWYFGDPSIADYKAITSGGSFSLYFISSAIQLWNSGTPVFQPSMTVPRNKWTFIQVIRTSTATNGLVFYLDGVAAATGTDGTNWTATGVTYFFTEGSRPANGYVTDLRVSVVARTPGRPTAPLSSDANTRLLTLQNRRFIDNSSTASTITPSGDAAIKTFNPYTITETDITTGSGYFDGTGDYLSIGTAANWVSLHNTAAQWTMDFWVYPITYNGSLLETCDSSTQIGIFLGLAAGGLVVLQIMRGVISSFVINVTGSVSAPLNAWSHIQISYDYNLASNNVAIYVNGTVNTASAGSFTKTANAPSSSNPTSPLYVGYSTASQFQGYITDLRIRTGIAVSSAPTLPTTSVAIDANTQLLTLQYRQGENNHRFLDEAGPKAVITRVGNASQGSFSPYSQQGWSVYFDGSTSYLTASLVTGVLSGTWTVEFWTNLPTLGVQYTFTNINSGSFTGIHIWKNSSNQLVVDDGANAQTAFSTVTFATAGVWYHVAVTRDGTTTRGYINGALAGSHAFTPATANSVHIGRYNSSPFTYLLGYISNFRVVNGTVLYTAAFTPPTTSLPAVAGVALLTCQSNRFIDTTGQGIVVTPFGSPKVQAVSPFRTFTNNVYNPAYSPLLHGGSMYFDGSGDYINIANSGAVTLFTNDHTIEFWMYPDGAQTQYSVVWNYSTGSASFATNNYYFSIGSNAGGDMTLLYGNGAGGWALQITIGATEYAKILNNWTHVVLTRSGTAFRIILNGVLRAYGTASNSITAQAAAFAIGWDGANATTYYKGWLSDFRLINGSIPTAYQTAATATGTTVFTPPSALVTAEANTVIRTTFTNSGIYDAGGRVNLETFADARVSNAQNKFGGSSLYFDGTGDYLLVGPTPDLEFGSGDFTIEFWWYPTSTVRQGLYHGSFGTDWSVGIDYNSVSTNKIGIWASSNGSSWNLINADAAGNGIGTTTISQNQWSHIAYVRSGTSWMLFVNGSRDLNITGLSGTIVSRTTSRKAIGSWFSTGSISQAFGYFDDFRISKYARYTANFTAPTSAFLTK